MTPFTGCDRAVVVRVAICTARRLLARLPVALPPEHIDVLVSDVAVVLLASAIGVVELDGELVLIGRGKPPEPELVG